MLQHQTLGMQGEREWGEKEGGRKNEGAWREGGGRRRREPGKGDTELLLQWIFLNPHLEVVPALLHAEAHSGSLSLPE